MRALFALSLLSSISAAQHAHGTDSLGTVHFATSCRASTAANFDRAVAALHSFEFSDAINGFQAVLATDSTCGMAYWGIALSRWSNPMVPSIRTTAQLQAGHEAAENAVRVSRMATPREQAYIAAVGQLYDDFEHLDQPTRLARYENAMDSLATREPLDAEAQIFHAIALVASASPTDKTYASQLRAGAVLESLWVKQPNHPGLAHYIIHAYDNPSLAPRAAAAAAKYANIAPTAAHALHMPSHTFTRRGQWDQSIATNRRSVVAARNAGGYGEAMHATDYMVYALLQQGRDNAARALVDSLPLLASRFDPNSIVGAATPDAGVFAMAAIPTRYALERRDWKAAAALPIPAATQAYPWTAAMIYFARALGATHTGESAIARASIDSLTAIQTRLAAGGNAYWAEQVAIQQLGASAWLALDERKPDSALALMREAAMHEDATEKSAVTPGPLLPARELLGDLLLYLNAPKEALAEYQAVLAKEPNRFRALYGAMKAAAAAGEKTKAAQYRAGLRVLCVQADKPGRVELREIR